MVRLAHIINPVKVQPTSDLHIAQPITFETMRRAKAQAPDHVEVELYTTQYPEDHEILPEGFTVLPDLERSVLDVAEFQIPRKLPLIKDILDRLYAGCDADYMIYTNTDIALMPYFYEAVANMIEEGYDAFAINRRTIPGKYKDISEIPQMYTELGKDHAGHDCFVFKRSAYANFQLGNVCVGAMWIGRIIAWNMMVYSENFSHLQCSHLTFHIGDDRVWLNGRYDDYNQHNINQGYLLLASLESIFGRLDYLPQSAPFLLWVRRPGFINEVKRNIRNVIRLITFWSSPKQC